MLYFHNLIWTVLSVVFGLRDDQMYRGCFSSEKVAALSTVIIKNVLKMKPYLPCGCKRDPECDQCGGTGDAPGLNSHGKLYGPRKAKDGIVLQEGTLVRLSRYTGRGMEKLTARISGGLVGFLETPKQIPCFCKGENKSCHFCSGGGMTYDRWLVQVPALIGTESTALVVACLIQIRKLAEARMGFNYVMIVQKGGGVILATLDAFREIDPNLEEGKLIKRFGYYVGNFMWNNTSEATMLRVLLLKGETKWNGVCFANVEVQLNKERYEGVAFRDYSNKVLKGTIRGIDKAELIHSLKVLEDNYGYTGVKDLRVDAICTEELIKVAPADLLVDTDTYSVFEVNIAEWKAVAPPVTKGRPAIGLTIWKYGVEGLKLGKLIISNLSTTKSIKKLCKALSGDYKAECDVLGVRMPDPNDERQISGFNMPILKVSENKFKWANPKDDNSIMRMFDRFLSFYRDNVLRIEVQGCKEILISSSILIERFQELADDYNEKHGIPRALYAIFPDQHVFTDNGEVDMIDALNERGMTFVMKKDPAGSILQFIPLTPISNGQWEHFLTHGNYVPVLADEEWVLCNQGAVLVSSKFRWIMCLPDLDGDKCSLLYMDKKMAPSCPPVTDWDTMWADNIKTEKPDLQSDFDIQRYIANMMINVVCARGAIGPIVRGGVAAAVERTAYGILTGSISKMTDDMWHYLQQLWIGISEIMGIKKEKTLADAKQRFMSFVDVVDMGKKFYDEGYTISKGSKIPDAEYDEQAASAEYMREVYMSLVSPKGEEYIEDEETGELELTSSMNPKTIFETLIVKAQDIDEIFPKSVMDYFPLIHMVRRFKSAVIEDIEEQEVASLAGIEEDDRFYYSLSSDSQKQNWVFHRALQFFLIDHPRAAMVLDHYKTAANRFVRANRAVIRAVHEEFGVEKSFEKSNYKRLLMEQVIEIPVQLGFVTRHAEKPWQYGDVLMRNNATLFALLVGIADTQYISEGYEDGHRSLRDGNRTSFNKCPKSEVIGCFLAAYANSPIGDFDGSGRSEKVNTLPGFKYPEWVKEEVLPDYSGYDAPEWTDEDALEM